MNTTLDQLGVSANLLSGEEKSFLAKYGYVSLGKLLSNDQLQQVRSRIEALLAEEGEAAGAELMESQYIKHPKEKGADRLADLVNKGAEFDIFYTHPKVLAGIVEVLGQQIKLSSLNYRAAKPGMGQQKLHVDWHETVEPGNYQVCNSIWLLDDFTIENGATRVVPGTHLIPKTPSDEMENPMGKHSQEQYILAPAGTVVIFNSHTWHGGTTNRTDQDRRAIHSYFCRRNQPQQVDQSKYIKEDTLSRISLAAKEMLDV